MMKRYFDSGVMAAKISSMQRLKALLLSKTQWFIALPIRMMMVELWICYSFDSMQDNVDAQ
jgi:hypothetical protein